MTPGGLEDGLDPVAVARATRELAASFMDGSKPVLLRMADDITLPPPVLIAAVVRAHLLGAASMVAAMKPQVDSLLLVTWLIEALGEAMADVAGAEEAA